MPDLTGFWKRMTEAQRRDFMAAAFLLLLCGWLYLAGHARYGLFDVDEAIFTQATVEMRHADGTFPVNLAMPTYNGEPRYHKPPLVYWAQDAFMNMLGEGSLYAARLPSALAALATVLLLGFGVWRLTGDRKWALMSAAAMAFNISFIVIGRAATADGLLNLTSLALALWVTNLLYGHKAITRHRWDFAVTGVLAALGFLAKGPVAWIPALVVVAFATATRRDIATVWRTMRPVQAAAVLLAALSPWLALLVAKHGLGFFYEFFIVHNYNRYASGLSNTQSTSHFYYLLVVLVGFFPWSLILLRAIPGFFKDARKDIATHRIEHILPLIALAWAAVYIVFFSFSGTKLAHYIVPAYPALAIIVGWWLSRPLRQKMPGWLVGSGVTLTLAFALVALLALPVLQGLRDATLTGWLGWLQLVLAFDWPPRDPLAFATLAQPIRLDYAFPAIGAVLLLAFVPAWVLLGRAAKGSFMTLCFVWSVCLGLIIWGVVPDIWRYTQAPLARMAARIAEAPPSIPVIHLGLHKPSVLYISGRPFLKLERPLQLPENIRMPETLVLTEEPSLPAIKAELATQNRGVLLTDWCEGGFCLLVVGRI